MIEHSYMPTPSLILINCNKRRRGRTKNERRKMLMSARPRRTRTIWSPRRVRVARIRKVWRIGHEIGSLYSAFRNSGIS